MLTIPGRSGKSCDGVSRRNFLRVGSLSALGMSLPSLLQAKAASPRDDVSCILVWLQGGLSHLDSFDPKPDAALKIRGEFSAISTKVPGIQICEHLPKLAMQQDKFSIIRSLNPQNGSHGVAESYMLSGYPFHASLTFPSYGSVVAREIGSRRGMPSNVQIGQSIDARFGGGGAGFLGNSFDPFIVSYPTIPSGENPVLLDRYGRHSLGQSCLLARRLTESGVRFVTVTDSGWDTHLDSFGKLRDNLLPRLDSSISALLQDLSDRGRLDSTLVMVLSDFGRTPKVNSAAGRDHCSTASVALMAGAGLKAGIVVGQTNANGELPIDSPCFTEDIAATIYNRFGITRSMTHVTPAGQILPVNYGGRLIRELL